MAPFRWPSLNCDIMLAIEVSANKPEKVSEWDAIADRLSAVFSQANDGKVVELKARGCKDRMERLLKKYEIDDSRSLKRFVQ